MRKKTLANSGNRNLEGSQALGWAGPSLPPAELHKPIEEHLLCPPGAGAGTGFIGLCTAAHT